MSFKDSLSAVRFLSELYVRDAPGAVLMTEYPSSNSPDTRFRNTSKYIIHDPFPAPELGLLKTLGPHHLMYGWGQHLAVTSELAPPAALVAHWNRMVGHEGCPNWVPMDEDQSYITSFPFETIPAERQLVPPDRLYHLHSKQAIADIPCSQADVYKAVQFPCILKLSHGYAGLGNYFVRNQDDLAKAKADIAAHWPDAPIVINELLTDIIGDYGVQFYLDTQGVMTWLGFTQQVFSETGRWTGGIFNADIQEQFYDEFHTIAEPVARYLHENGYFGVVGIDILQTKRNGFFLVDLNPRLTGITPFLMMSRLFIADGYSHGLYATSVEITGRMSDVIAKAEAMSQSRVLVLSAYEAPGSNTIKCHLSISGTSLQACEQSLAGLRALT